MTYRRTLLWSLAVAVLAVGAGGVALTQAPPAPKAAEAKQPTTPAADDRKDDRAAIQATVHVLRAMFESGDAQGCAAVWTAEGEYIADDGVTIRGRTEVEKSYAELFAKYPKPRVTAEQTSLRFVSRDAAVEEGYFQVKLDATAGAVTSRYSILFAREDGKWRVAVLREWPAEGANLRDLDWLVGEWEGTRDGASVRAVYEWDLNKTVIRGRYTVTRAGEGEHERRRRASAPQAGPQRACFS